MLFGVAQRQPLSIPGMSKLDGHRAITAELDRIVAGRGKWDVSHRSQFDGGDKLRDSVSAGSVRLGRGSPPDV